MSEYQYYEFQAVDRRLTPAEMQALRSYSTRAQITPTSFVNEYNWGDFRGDVDAWMERYFDAFLYFANWGTRTLKLRLPVDLLDLATVRAYLDGECSSARRKGKYLILTFESECDGGDDMCDFESAGLLSSMVSLRTDLERGDRRALYLAWLVGLSEGYVEEDAIEPPVPAGLGELNGSLQALADFLRVDADLLEVAAQASAAQSESTLPHEVVANWVATLEPAEKDGILTRLVLASDDPAAVAAGLRHRLCRERDDNRSVSSRSPEPRRTVGELLRAAEQRSAERAQVAAQKAAEEKLHLERELAAARACHLDRLVGHEPRLWVEVERLVATKVPKSYDQAVVHLVDLRDIATRREREGCTAFAARLEQFRVAHARKPSLLSRLDHAGL